MAEMSDAAIIKNMHPNDLTRINAPDSIKDKAAWPSESRRELLKRMLDASLEDTIPTAGLIKAFEQPQTVECFASLITLDPTPMGSLDNDFDDSRYQKPYTFPLEARPGLDEADLLDLKRAHRAMTIVSSDQPMLQFVVRSKPLEILAPTLRAFRCQNSKASIYHLCKVVESLLRANTNTVISYMTGPRTKLILQGFLANLHCPQVADLLFAILTIRASQENDLQPETLKAFHKKVSQANPMATLANNVVSDNVNEGLRIASADLILRLLIHFDAIPLDPPQPADLGESFLFKALVVPAFLDKLAFVASSDTPCYEAAIALLEALCKLAAKGRLAKSTPLLPVEDEDDKPKEKEAAQGGQRQKRRLKDFVPTPAPSQPKAWRLTKLGEELKTSLRPASMGATCTRALDAAPPLPGGGHKHTSYDVAVPFTYRRLEWLRALNHLLELDYKAVPLPWKSLVSWQAQYPQNSMLQSEFTKALQTILVNSPSSDECKPAVIECKVISHLIKRAKENDTDHAHVLKCLNLFRLKADLLPKQHWLSQYLKSHTGWTEFLPELKRQTRVTIEPWLNEAPGANGPGGHPAVSAINSAKNGRSSDVDSAAAALNALFMSDPDNPLTALARQTTNEMVREEKELSTFDVEIGSRYAKSLGFTSTKPIVLEESKIETSEKEGKEPKRKSTAGSGKKKKKN